ncbi:MAG: CDP-alcohol phosphatidyltransferase family protein [bacterium]|nr:CDP-alcohol phosphatidyltransferase family protein [bacterium]
MPLDKSAVQAWARKVLNPLAGLILRMGFSPDALTLAGLILSLVSGGCIARGYFTTAAILLLLSGLCDMLDGAMARRGNRTSLRGAFLDSTFDRLAEVALYLGLFYFYRDHNIIIQVLILLTLTGSLLTSYTRARAEGLNVECKVGILERPERLVLLILGLFAAPWRFRGIGFLELVIAFQAVFTYITTFQRILHVMGKTGPRFENADEPAEQVMVESSADAPEKQD